MVLNGAAITAASTGFQAIFTQGWEGASPHYPEWCMQMQSTGESETYQWDGGLPQLREWIGERHRRNFEIEETNIKNRTWELLLAVKREKFEDDKLGLLSQRVLMLGTAARMHPDTLFRDLLVNGFTDTGYDGEAFFSADHDSGSNLVSGALASGTFNTAIEQIRKQTTPEGEPIDVMSLGGELCLMVAPNLESTARGILLAQYGSNGASNTDFGRAKLKVFNRLPDDHWFLGINGSPIRPLIFQMRRMPNMVARDNIDDEAVWNRNEVEFGTDGRWAMGYGLHQMLQGSTGS